VALAACGTAGPESTPRQAVGLRWEVEVASAILVSGGLGAEADKAVCGPWVPGAALRLTAGLPVQHGDEEGRSVATASPVTHDGPMPDL
jgi:hypothetical protein